MKSPPMQIHDDIAFNRVEAFIRGEDNETLVGTETLKPKKTRKLAASKRTAPIEVQAQASSNGATAKAGAKAGAGR